MAELSKNRTRVGTQDRPVYRRDSILPNRMGVNDAVTRRDNVDIRAARRGDGGADAVMQLARQVNGAFQDVARYDAQKFAYDEEQNAFKAVEDRRKGLEPDPALMEESAAYKSAFALSNVKARMSELEPKAKERAQQVINGYAGADPEELMGLVEKELDGTLQQALLDEHGQPIDLGSAQAYAVAGSRVGSLTDAVRADARGVIRTKIQSNGKNAEVNRVLAAARNGEVIDVPTMFETLGKYQIDDDAKRATLVNVLEILEKEAPGVAADLAGQLAGIPVTVKALRADGPAATTTETLKPSGRLPIAGRVTARMGDGRNHNGVDIDGRIGDPVEAPAGGKVIKVDRNPNQRAGVHVVIDHGNGVTSSYSHLDGTTVEEGQVIRPGQKFATVGNTGNVKKGPNGDGSHLHWVVRNGKNTVDPMSFQFPEYTADAPVVETAKALAADKPGLAMVLPAGLQFSPEELQTLTSLRERGLERQRTISERAEQERHEATRNDLFKGILAGNWPSKDQLNKLAASGQLSYDAAYTFNNLYENEQRSNRAEARADADLAERTANRLADERAAGIALDWKMGNGPRTRAEFDRYMRTNINRLGSGANRLQNYNVLDAAFEGAQRDTVQNPDYRMYSSTIGTWFSGGGSGIAAVRGGAGANSAQKLQAQNSFYTKVVVERKDPATAFNEVAKEFNRPGNSGKVSLLQDTRNELSDLQARRTAEQGQ